MTIYNIYYNNLYIGWKAVVEDKAAEVIGDTTSSSWFLTIFNLKSSNSSGQSIK